MQKNTVKKVANFVVGASVFYSVTHLIEDNVEAEKNHQKVELYIGSGAVGSMVAAQSKPWTDKMIDDAYDLVDSIKALKKK